MLTKRTSNHNVTYTEDIISGEVVYEGSAVYLSVENITCAITLRLAFNMISCFIPKPTHPRLIKFREQFADHVNQRIERLNANTAI